MKNLLISALVALSLVGCATAPAPAPAPGRSDNHTGYTLAKKGELTQAEPYFLRALAADRNDPYPLTNLGYLYELQGKWSQAREMYNRVLALNLSENKKPLLETGGTDRAGAFEANEAGFVEPAVESFNTIARRNLAGINRMERNLSTRP